MLVSSCFYRTAQVTYGENLSNMQTCNGVTYLLLALMDKCRLGAGIPVQEVTTSLFWNLGHLVSLTFTISVLWKKINFFNALYFHFMDIESDVSFVEVFFLHLKSFWVVRCSSSSKIEKWCHYRDWSFPELITNKSIMEYYVIGNSIQIFEEAKVDYGFLSWFS